MSRTSEFIRSAALFRNETGAPLREIRGISVLRGLGVIRGIGKRAVLAAALSCSVLSSLTFVSGCRTTHQPATPDTVVSKEQATAEMLALIEASRPQETPFQLASTQLNGPEQNGPDQVAPDQVAPAEVAFPEPAPIELQPANISVAQPAPKAVQSIKPSEIRSNQKGIHDDHAMLLDELDTTLSEKYSPKTDVNQVRDYGLIPVLPSPVASATTEVFKPFSSSELPTNQWELTEVEMLSIAMSNSPVLRPLGIRIIDNPESVTTRYDVAIAATDPFFGPQAALAEFDSQLSASLTAQNNDRVFNNAILGGAAQELVQDVTMLDTGLQKRTRSGATIDFGVDHLYDNNNRDGNLFRNYWETQWQAGIRQPLLQGAGRNFNLIAGPNARPGFNFSRGIVIAKLNVKVTEADFEIEVRDFVRDLYQTYWDLKQQYLAFEQIRSAEKLAYQTWQTVKAKRQASVTGGDANKEAQARARYYAFRRQLRSALDGDGGQAGLYVVERRLRYLMGVPIVDGRLIRPIDQTVDARFTFDFDNLVSRAIGNRTEITRQSLRLRQEELKLMAAKNFLLPQMDMIGRYRLRGFGDDLTGGGERFASAYKDFFSLEHQEWEFGVEMGVTAGRRQAKAAVRNASLQVHRERQIMQELRRSVGHQVADAYGEVESSYESLEASVAQVDAATERLQASWVQYQADKLPIEFLLDAQEELLRAQTQMAADQTRYAVSLVDIGATTGSLLSDVGLHIADDKCGKDLVFFGN